MPETTPTAAPTPEPSAAPASTPDTPVDLRPLMAGFPTGVSIVTTTASDGEAWGMTCTSLCSVSLDPPTLLVCLRRGSPTLDAVLDSGTLAVNLLHDQARPTAELFASGAPDRFRRVAWRGADGRAGPHLVEDAHTVADCTVVDVPEVGTHAMVLGHVRRIVQLRDQQPLLYGQRRFASWAERSDGGHLLYDFIS